jgi:hypothetical protein
MVSKRKAYLWSIEERRGKSLRQVDRMTPLGRKALLAARAKLRELVGELIGGA